MKLSDFKKVVYGGSEVDPDPGAYYVSVVDGPKFGLIAGPFNSHPEALAMVEAAKKAAHKADPWSDFYAFGTCKLESSVGPGVLNKVLGLAA